MKSFSTQIFMVSRLGARALSLLGPWRRGLMCWLLGALLPLLMAPLNHAQAPAWQLAVAAGGPTFRSQCAATATDAAGNLYLTGLFYNTVDFGGITLTSAGGTDVYVAKWSPATGSFVWAVRAGGAGYDRGLGIAVNGTSIYLTGAYDGPTATFGTTVLANASIAPAYYDVFVAKLVDAGSSAAFSWAQGFGGTANDVGMSVAVSGSNVYLTGYFESPTLTCGPITLANAGGADGFVVKLTDAGSSASVGWAQQIGGADNEYSNTVAARGADVFIAGNFQSPTISFGSVTLTNITFGAFNMFVVKLTDTGPSATVGWARLAGGSGFTSPSQVVVSGGNVYIAGSFNSIAFFGSTTLSNTSSIKLW